MTTAVEIVFERTRKPPDTNCQAQLNLKEVAEQYASGESSLDPKHLQLNGVARSSSTRSDLTYFSFKPGCSVHTSPSFSQKGTSKYVVDWCPQVIMQLLYKLSKCVANQGWGLNHSWVSEVVTFPPDTDQGLLRKCHSQSVQTMFPGQLRLLS